jgi:hypothetical protein
MNITQVENTGYAPIIMTAVDVAHFHVHIERPQTNKCESIPLQDMISLFTASELLAGFEGKLADDVWYRLTTKNRHEVNNWKYALRNIHALQQVE